MEWYIGAFVKYVDFRGRAGRKEFWNFILFNLIVAVMLASIDVSMLGPSEKATFGMFSMIYAIAALLPGLGVSVRRLHDIDRSGWWLLLVLIPLIGAIVLLVFYLTDSDPNENSYGLNPKCPEDAGVRVRY